MIPIKDKLPPQRTPLVTLALLVATVAVSSVLEAGGILFVAASALALWLFGPGVEDSLGRLRFLAFAVAGAAAAALAQLAIDSGDVAAACSAGVVAAAAGGYLALYPRGKILTVSAIPFFFGVVEVPTVVYVALWCVVQVLAGPALALVAAFGLGLVLARTLVDPERDRRGMPPRVPAF